MSEDPDYLAADDQTLLADCNVHLHRASGPGGQHRNKVSSAVRLHHCPTGLTAQANESRSQHENRRRATGRLRMKLACMIRRPVDLAASPPPVVTECIFAPRGRKNAPLRRLEIGRKDRRFWRVAAHLLDLLTAADGRVRAAASALGITTGNFISLLRSDRHLWAAAADIRKRCGGKPLT